MHLNTVLSFLVRGFIHGLYGLCSVSPAVVGAVYFRIGKRIPVFVHLYTVTSLKICGFARGLSSVLYVALMWLVPLVPYLCPLKSGSSVYSNYCALTYCDVPLSSWFHTWLVWFLFSILH